MTASVIDSVRNLLLQFTFQIVPDDIFEDLSCVSCRKLTINPYQTHCGCIYCQECVAVHFGSSDNYCSGGREHCREEYIILEKNVLKSAVINRNILRLKVCCPNRLCDSVTELTHMSEHIRVCTKHSQKCPYSNIGCDDDGISKEAMLTHLHDNSITHSEMLVDLIQNLRNEINELKEDFTQNQLEIPTLKEESRVKDAEKEQLMNEMAERMNTLCNELSDQRREIEMINKTNGEKIRQLEERIQEQQDELQSHKKDILMKIEKEKKESNIKMTVSVLATRQLEERIQKQEDEVQLQTKDILDIIEKEKEIGLSVAKSVSAVQTRVKELMSVIDGINIRKVSFKMDGFRASKSSVEGIYSPHFYSHINGYKLRLHVYPGGQGDGYGTHVSVYIDVCKGEYDDLLEWPFSHSVTISIVNQSSGENHTSRTLSYSTDSDVLKALYHKPIEGDNTGHGYPTFIPHNTLQSSPGLIVDDTLFFHCVVTPPQVGSTTFKVGGFSASKASMEEIYSPYFYSHTNGYKLRLLVYPGGQGYGSGTHVSVFIVVCKGEYDHLLGWPCEHSAIVSIVNQISGENHTSRILSHSTALDECKALYHKPFEGDNSGHGYHTFISHTSLQSSPGLIVGDSLLFRCVVTPPQVGSKTFKVGGFSAIKALMEGICTSHLYSHTNGYKLRLVVYPGGDRDGRGTHVSVYIVVCKGEYDDLLEWPFMYNVTISIVNHNSGENYTSRKLSYSGTKEAKHCYHKPIDGDNPAHGCPSFISHTILESSPGLIVDDALLLRCTVTPPP